MNKSLDEFLYSRSEVIDRVSKIYHRKMYYFPCGIKHNSTIHDFNAATHNA